jgi:hypothetical protein
MAPPTFVVDHGRTAKCPELILLICLTRALDPGLLVPGLSKDTKRHQLQTRITAFAEVEPVEQDKRATKMVLPQPKPKPDCRVRSEDPIRKIEAFIDWAIETVDRRMYENGKA